MNFMTAMQYLDAGELVTRPGLSPRFLAKRGGRLLIGAYIGETGLADMRRYLPDESDLGSADWRIYARTLPDEWIGCDVPDA
ncbi:MAG: hypothetical protein PUB01_02700 [Desulfovibrionaceae bacterium]|nr:hypothetical protein [Desulfovibrionaceae bacterium]